MIIINAVLLICWLSKPSTAQTTAQNDTDSTTRNQRVQQILQEMEEETKTASTFPDSIIVPPTPAQQQLLDDSTLAVYRDAMYAYYEYRVSGFEHRKQVFAWQLFSSKLIFWCVLLLVFSGISFSGIQFYKSIRSEPASDADSTGQNLTEFEATASGIKVSSPVLGVIILALSLAFFYLYLVYVHPIREIF
ncbi:hypothetical protein [Fodinibius sediminis]|uniref:hypothetical protein n=1 Tax=Fodinibius sediminis TaxID=1214077 RepID=UPI0011587237|nr:hypothetical protein [Fodinibius sediminis]